MRKIVILSVLSIAGFAATAQIRKTPAAVTTAFEKQYPSVSKVQYEDNMFNVQVHFMTDSGKMVAKYESSGKWKETERTSIYDSLPAEVKGGFDKSKFSAEWKVKEANVIYLPDGETRYRLKVEKNDVAKRYLFFDKNGRLIKDSITL